MQNDTTGGLTDSELALAVAELRRLVGARVVDVALISGREDLLVVVRCEARKEFLHVALGAGRARLCLTRRRFEKGAFASGPGVDRLRTTLDGAELTGIEQPDGERRCTLRLGDLAVEVELFGNRGLWCLVDRDGSILELSRRARGLQRGDRYEPPRSRPAAPGGTSRFAAPVSDAVDRHFTAIDLAAEGETERRNLARVLGARRRKLSNRIEGLTRQQEEIAGLDELRRQADLMLAHSHEVDKGATAMSVPDPESGGMLHFELDPSKSVIAQAQAFYKRARRLADSARVAQARRAEADRELRELASLEEQLAAGSVEEVARRLESLRLQPRQKGPRPGREKPAVEFRRFESLEGHAILVGRNNAENDRLSMRVARGNDLWVHVGGGRAGSHVVVRLPRDKTASLETLLDAGTLAIHFSRYRGSPLCEVVYTPAKHLRKPKGLSPGRVLVNRSRTLRVRLEPERLERLLRRAER